MTRLTPSPSTNTPNVPHSVDVSSSQPIFETISYQQCRTALLQRKEIALLDVREEAPFAEAHPLFAANMSLSRIELDSAARIPRLDTLIVVYDDGEGLARNAAQRLQQLGYSNIKLLDGGLAGWRSAGGEIFRDVNAPSKAFGELVDVQRHTPSLSAPEVQALLNANADVVVLDARRFDEYNTMSIPTGISVPGAELVLRVQQLAPRPETRVIVNCAGRTRSIIGTQSLVNAGIPNPVSALRNGTIGWTLAGQTLDTRKTRQFADFGSLSPEDHAQAQRAARKVADKARVSRVSLQDESQTLIEWKKDNTRTTYRFDVRTPEEYAAGHLPDFRSAPGGQLVQETDHAAPVRGARIVLSDDDGVRANMTASWLAQMGWEVFVIDGAGPQDFTQQGTNADNDQAFLPPVPTANSVTAQGLAAWLENDLPSNAAEGETVILDFTSSANYVKHHIPGAWFALRSQLAAALDNVPPACRYVLTCGTSLLARYILKDLQALTTTPVWLLEGGTSAWIAAGLPQESGESALASPRIDRYRRPYEGTDNPAAAMQAYLDWEYGLVDQLALDGTHGFFVI
ncbi:rhodanese homology domain-containing protein [Glaciimonas sp. Gout2]|uniref:rhodanese homology domain-containing protein n=1 Tax=unclassified Glaciimonas TaxID=2644401 RepID=UPI002B23A6D2|nr:MULTISPECIES: rhodanese homology domain-containing protein [unclassified Glaciimonas]MEB0012927.1 rhodanese homology domain-containing protein [Glaciimonas sp. Cout2]MEB0080781.1 rhodanese homology domain-containing protein [Glaciimonas sp. Gout2]